MQLILEELNKNNIKLSAHKTQCFPQRLDLLGWTKEGELLVPDPHRQNRLLDSKLPTTVKQLRSYLGTYETFYKCKKNIYNILKDLQRFASNKTSSEKLEWTPEQKITFEESKQEAKHLDKLYHLPISSHFQLKFQI